MNNEQKSPGNAADKGADAQRTGPNANPKQDAKDTQASSNKPNAEQDFERTTAHKPDAQKPADRAKPGSETQGNP
ncbi:MAG TPA: hypothetical protein VHL57_11160 [Flavobacteriales bacterium]|jgi:hypothetical protein|nr:hypothetical protein [Flavobacteriales bacterium]